MLVNVVRICKSKISFYELVARYPATVSVTMRGRAHAIVRLRAQCGKVTIVMWEGSATASIYGAPCEPDFLYECKAVLAVGRVEASVEGILRSASLVCKSESICRGYLPLDDLGPLPVAVYFRGNNAVVIYFVEQDLVDKISLIERIISSL
jgi:hypothetical protein